ncbi:hypothetical protein B0920_24435 [Massilia sp. KIM]|uniref:hypothetical protein n=1 Tax=Massilia sp. KIM TaxID=1955422 RepID=UPI00098EEF1C|nr:hypothetical protein [Massilia sp. KIM]OON59523.1 hypothetical protein B0920_24435 [Massilia sp. KIM]
MKIVDNQDQDSAPNAEGAPSNPRRRRFASTGIKASGVILTVASPPAMATYICKSPSGFMSGNLKSSPGNQTVICSGLSPGYWKNWPQAWPSGCYPTATKYRPATTFASVFPGGGTTLYQRGTLMQVLTDNNNSQDPYNLGAHLVAAYLNVRSNKINYFTETSLKIMWHDLCKYGYYSPKAGTRWTAADVAYYLSRTEH